VYPTATGSGGACSRNFALALQADKNRATDLCGAGSHEACVGATSEMRVLMTTDIIRRGRRQCLADIDTFVLAGGMGTRIRPVLGDTPKLLAPIQGKTYLAYLLDWLVFFGARRIVFGLGHGSQAIRAELDRESRADLTIATVVEPEPLGTAGAIGFSRDQLHSDPVLVLNGDSFVEADLCKFIASYRAHDRLGAVICTEVPDGRRYGGIRVDANGDIAQFIEKSAALAGTATINAGVYLLSARLLDTLPRTHNSSIERDIFPSLKPGTLQAFAGSFPFIDIGTPASLAEAANIFKRVPSPDNKIGHP
jgi:mannose-1-phosphate guanylyltransferase